jgi:hypothetical protein
MNHHSGLFGLNNQPVNFSDLGNSTTPSFLTTLKDKDIIPSLSWSYTAGAKYRAAPVSPFHILLLTHRRLKTGLWAVDFLRI